jgi:hypothetical protein
MWLRWQARITRGAAAGVVGWTRRLAAYRPAACQVHHICPRREGGRTSLTNLILLCAFHHLIAVPRWDWAITLHPDGTVTAVSPGQQRTLHSHSPPARAA